MLLFLILKKAALKQRFIQQKCLLRGYNARQKLFNRWKLVEQMTTFLSLTKYNNKTLSINGFRGSLPAGKCFVNYKINFFWAVGGLYSMCSTNFHINIKGYKLISGATGKLLFSARVSSNLEVNSTCQTNSESSECAHCQGQRRGHPSGNVNSTGSSTPCAV